FADADTFNSASQDAPRPRKGPSPPDLGKRRKCPVFFLARRADAGDRERRSHVESCPDAPRASVAGAAPQAGEGASESLARRRPRGADPIQISSSSSRLG